MGRLVAAVDMGATWTRVELLDWRGRVLASRRYRTPRVRDGEAVARRLAREILGLAGGLGGVASAGVASFGPIDYGRGSVVSPPNHPAREIPLRRVLEEELGAPVFLVNDAVAGAWSEYVLGGRARSDLAYVALGTGIGVGIVVGGRLLLGRRGDSHEAGHMVLDYSSAATCGCGGRGHWEALASGSALAARGEPPLGLERAVAAGLASLVACYDPEIIALGGGLVESGRVDPGRLAPLVREYGFLGRVPPIVRHILGGRASIHGAYLIARKPPEELLRLNGW